ncbi:MAG: hypothetical protein LBF27_16370 [Sphingobacterium sp.]|nr:hypothetical protein [Sphingobacterium sp.]
MRANGLYIFDQTESALSIIKQLNRLNRIRQFVDLRSEFIIATHSPILLVYPEADIYQITDNGIKLIAYQDTEQYKLMKYFMNYHERMLSELGFAI